MKWLCLLLGLLNVVFVLWEVRNDQSSAPIPDNSQLATILLVTEQQRAVRGSRISALIDQPLVEGLLAKIEDSLIAWPPSLTAVNDPVKSLLLANATPVIPEPTPPPKVEAADSKPEPKTACYLAGPFSDEAGMMQWLQANALTQSDTVFQEGQQSSDFQVYFPAAKTPEQLRINKMMLNAKGVVDVWMVPSGDHKGALSLGVFADQQRANYFRNELLAKGVKAEVSQRFKSVPQLYAKVMLDKARQNQLLGRSNPKLAQCR